MNKTTTDKCLNPKCSRSRGTRGLCIACYNSACRMVKIGKTTWKSLEETGRVLSPHQNGKGIGTANWLLGK